jgi:signal peptide peptidase SppA
MIAQTDKCFLRHMGIVACEYSAVQFTLAMMKNNLLPMKSMEDFEEDKQRVSTPAYQIVDGVAVIKICGIMQKPVSKFDGFCSTVKVCASIAAADADPAVKGLFLYFDSPGGFAAGTHELSECIAGCEKPVNGFIADTGASAGYWIASQCDKLSMNEPGRCGSIGTYGVIEDTSKAFEMDGVKAILVTSGALKGQGSDGVPVSDAAIAAYQSQVDDITARFINAVAAGRGMSAEAVKELATGATFSSSEALDLGLIDAVECFDDALENFINSLNNEPITGAIEMPENEKEIPAVVAPVSAAPAVAEPEAVTVIPEKSIEEIIAEVKAEKDVEIQALKSENAELKASQVIVKGAEPVAVVPAPSMSAKVPMYDANGKFNRSK